MSTTAKLRMLGIVPLAAVVVAGAAACTVNEHPSDTPGTTPAVITGDQVPTSGIVNEEPEDSTTPAGAGDTAQLQTPTGTNVGQATFTEKDGKVVVTLTVHGLPAGFHGVHIHSVGKCEANSVAPTGGAPGAFLSAGAHFQVDGHTTHPASGDLVSLLVNADGSGETVTATDAFTLQDIAGKSIIVHELPDNFGNIPERYGKADETTMNTGDAGSRIACGVIS